MLAFVGVKMLIADRFPIPDWLSLVVVAGLILGAALVSLLFPLPASDPESKSQSDQPG